MRTKPKPKPALKPTPAPKPITLGILESLEYMNNGVLPRRTCHACHVIGGILGYCLAVGAICGALVMLGRQFT